MQPEAHIHANPFPGLRPFESNENHLFFGRDGQSDELLRRLRERRFVAVVGTSGSGKSSLVRAGLLPSLHGGFMISAGSSWRVTIFRPGGNPIGALATALNSEDSLLPRGTADAAIQRSITEATLRRSSSGLADVVKQARIPAHENLLVVVDQFEEVFRYKKTDDAPRPEDDAAAFVKLLLEATRQRDVPVYVIITMRSDFLGDCSQFRDLPEAINEGQYLIPRMTRDQRREAITGPIAVGGATVTPRLVNRLLNDVGDNPDQLPILQHALMRTWQQWARGDHAAPIDTTDYESIGGMREALSRHADKAYDELPTERDRRIAERMFKLLTERGTDNREIRRPTRLKEICAVTEADEGEVAAVIESFRREGRSFLMPPASVPLGADSLIDISHESLIRGWHRLEKWVDDEALSARIYRRLAETAALYRADEAGLWREPDLPIALAWRDASHPNAAWGARYSPDFDEAMEFLEESKRARDDERKDRERQRRKTLRLTQALATVLLVGFLLSLGLFVFANRKRKEALALTLKAEASALRATQAETVARDERDRAERGKQEAQAARDEARKSKDQAERKAKEASDALRAAKESQLLAEHAKVEAQHSAELAQLNERKAHEALVEMEQQRKLVARLTRRMARLQMDYSPIILDMADRLMQVATPEEKAYWHALKGNAFLTIKNENAAISELTAALGDDAQSPDSQSPDDRNPYALTSRSYAYLLAGQTEKGVEDARAAVKQSPGNPAAYENLIIGLGILGRYDEAKDALRDGLKSFMHSGYGEYSENEVSPEIEQETGQKIIYAESNDALIAINYEMANLAAASGKDFPSALAEADNVARKPPGSMDTDNKASKRPAPADAYLFALNWAWLHQKFNPKDYGALAAQGALWERAGFPQRAALAYAKFSCEHQVKHDGRYEELSRWVKGRTMALHLRDLPCPVPEPPETPPDARRLSVAAIASMYSGTQDPLALLNRAVETDPTNLDMRINRGQFLFNSGNFVGAQREFDAILKQAPGNAGVRVYRALASMKAGLGATHDDIRRDIKEARRLDPSVVPDIYNLNRYADQISKILAEKSLDDAVDFFARGARYNPPLPDPYYVMAKLLNGGGRYDEALKAINVAIAMRSDRVEFYKERATAEEGKLRVEAERSGGQVNARRKTEIAHDEARGYGEAGDALRKFGEAGGALDAYSHSLKVLDQIAAEKGIEEVHCEVEMILEKITRIHVEDLKVTPANAAEYLGTFVSELKAISKIVKDEMARLSSAHPARQ
jgi:flagellar biosynthesis GTPase FlhF/energy-coupling factor transporter ATP-binding protein EcfA2